MKIKILGHGRAEESLIVELPEDVVKHLLGGAVGYWDLEANLRSAVLDAHRNALKIQNFNAAFKGIQ